MSVKMEVNEVDQLAVIYVSGTFDYTKFQDFNDIIEQEESSDATIRHLVLDLKGTDYMDSSALGMLIMLRDKAQTQDADIAIRGCNESILKILKIANFQKIFQIEGLSKA